MKNIHALVSLLIGFPLAMAAQDFGLNGITAASVGGGSVPAPAVGAAPALKKWTIIALVNGKNNLSEDAETDMNEMEAVG